MSTKKLVAELAATVREEAKKIAPQVTGELRRSIKILSLDESEATVGHDQVPNITVIGSHGEHIIYPIFVHERCKNSKKLEKNNLESIKLINQGLALDEQIEELEKTLKKLKKK
jgi:hypothetical protein